MAYHFRNLVFEGGGVKGIAYVGALEILDEKGILKDIQRVAGTSVGAMIAVMVGLRYSAEEMRKVLWDLKFKKFLDKSFGVANISRLLSEYGWYKGDYFRGLMVDLIKAKTGNGEITFKGLAETNKFMDIHLVGADLSTGTSLTFNAQDTPNVSIAEAARISMSIPVFFASVTGAKGDDNRKGHVFVDGGLLDNYSIKTFDKYSYVFDKEKNARRTEYYDKFNRKKSVLKDLDGDVYVYNKETLGFRLDAKEDISMYRTHNPAIRNKITSFFTYTKALVTTLIDFQNNVHLHSDDWQRTIYIDTLGVRAIDFGIDADKKRELLESGRKYTTEYLEWYDNDEEKANK